MGVFEIVGALILGAVVLALVLLRDAQGALTGTLRPDVPYRASLEASARQNGIDPCLLAGICKQESDFNPNAVNSSDPSYGIAQVMLPTANEVRPGTTKEDLLNPHICIEVAARYVKKLRDVYGVSPWPDGIDAYNVGPGNFRNGIRNLYYRDRVLRFRGELCK